MIEHKQNQNNNNQSKCYFFFLYRKLARFAGVAGQGPPSVTSGLGVSDQVAKLASPIGLLCEQLPKVYVFFAHKIFMTFCALFPSRISHFKIPAMP